MFLRCENLFTKICWGDAINNHILISGKSGTGKSVLMRRLAESFICEENIVIILDFDGQQSLGNIPQEMGEVIYIKDGLRLLLNDISSTAETLLMAYGIMNKRLRSQLSQNFFQILLKWNERVRNIGTVWRESFEIPLIALLDCGIDVPSELMEAAEKEYIFYILPNGRLLPKKSTLFWRLDFSGLSMLHKEAIAEYVLAEIYRNRMNAHTEKKIYIFIDEFQNFNFSAQSAFGRILVEGRKYGLGLCLATQFYKNAFPDKRSAQLGQADILFHFEPSQGEVNAIAKLLSKNDQEVKKYVQLLSHLERGECIMTAPHVVGKSKIISRRPRKVNVILEGGEKNV